MAFLRGWAMPSQNLGWPPGWPPIFHVQTDMFALMTSLMHRPDAAE